MFKAGEIDYMKEVLWNDKKAYDIFSRMVNHIEAHQDDIPRSDILTRIVSLRQRYMTPNAISNVMGATFNYWQGHIDALERLYEKKDYSIIKTKKDLEATLNFIYNTYVLEDDKNLDSNARELKKYYRYVLDDLKLHDAIGIDTLENNKNGFV